MFLSKISNHYLEMAVRCMNWLVEITNLMTILFLDIKTTNINKYVFETHYYYLSDR